MDPSIVQVVKRVVGLAQPYSLVWSWTSPRIRERHQSTSSA